MRKIQIRTVVENRSRYPIDLVWENAQDLEHVAFLHPNTNYAFELIHNEKSPDPRFEYSALIYRAKRRLLGLIPLGSFGFRRIVCPYNLHQVEKIPVLAWTSILNSQLLETKDSEFPTLMRDEVIIELPWIFGPLKNWISRNLQRHASIQCAEDEPFRERRQELRRREVTLPFKIYNESTYLGLSKRLQCKLPTPV